MPNPRTVTIILSISLCSSVGWWAGTGRRTQTRQWSVTEVIDGDTIVVTRSGETQTIRLLGVDTPNIAQHHLRDREGTAR